MPRKTAPYLKPKSRAANARRSSARRSSSSSNDGKSRSFLFLLILLAGGCFGGVAVGKIWLENQAAADAQLWESKMNELNAVRTEIKNLEPVRDMCRSAEFVHNRARALGLRPAHESEKISVPSAVKPEPEPIDLVSNP